MPKKQRFAESGLNSQFNQQDMNFSQYVAAIQTIIKQARIDLDGPNTDLIVNANSPFELQPDPRKSLDPNTGNIKNGILLIHGLYESPYHTRHLAKFFQQQHFLVRSILLPGHGTVPGDLLTVTYDDWIKASAYGIQSFADQVDNLYILGYSTGAVLALYHTLHNIDVKGLFLFAPALKITPFAALAHWHKPISKILQRAHWYKIGEDNDYAKYESFPFNSATQIHRLIGEVTALSKNKQIDVPMFMVLTADDFIISSPAAENFFNAQPNLNNRLILYTNVIKDRVRNKRIKYVCSHYPAQNIKNFSHACLAVPEDDPHYGPEGDYQPYLAVKAKNLSMPVYFGEISITSESKSNLFRLNYNPHFYNLLEYMKNFLLEINDNNVARF